MIGDEDRAARVKAWRGKLSARAAAEILGLPPRTLEGIEQGRGFRYPQLLLAAIGNRGTERSQ